MSALTDRIAAEHVPLALGTQPGLCSCGASPDNPGEYISSWRARHMAEVTEAAVREQVARDIGARLDRIHWWSAEEQVAYETAARIARGGAA